MHSYSCQLSKLSWQFHKFVHQIQWLLVRLKMYVALLRTSKACFFFIFFSCSNVRICCWFYFIFFLFISWTWKYACRINHLENCILNAAHWIIKFEIVEKIRIFVHLLLNTFQHNFKIDFSFTTAPALLRTGQHGTALRFFYFWAGEWTMNTERQMPTL